LVNRPHLSEVPGQRTRDLPCPTGKVKQPPPSIDRHPGPQVVEEDRRIRRPEPVVILGRSLVQVLPIHKLAAHLTILASTTRQRPRPAWSAGERWLHRLEWREETAALLAAFTLGR